DQSVTFEYVDDDNGGAVVGTPTLLRVRLSEKLIGIQMISRLVSKYLLVKRPMGHISLPTRVIKL
ncbi:hypothetical protein, partial [Secundilactobacillus silagei]|uniref:hypothetical protein n=1 Tax=Secundilactobacillus silagei TaxID=1293415 RepID=UPI000A75E46B